VTIAVLVAGGFIGLLFPSLHFGAGAAHNSASVGFATSITDVDYTIDRDAILEFETQDLVMGDGTSAAFGDMIYVHYVGLLENGDVFDTSTGSSQPFSAQLGTGAVIAGWDLGLVGMKEGGTRRLTIPAELAYGNKEVADASGNVIIPENSTLTFDVVLLRVVKQ